MTQPDFEPDEFVYVKAETAEAAREFLGTPPHWPVKRVEDGSWAIQADGLETE